MIAFRRILCPIDFSESSRHALDHAVEVARWYGGTITALHALQPIPYTDPLMAGALVFTPEDLERAGRDLAGFVKDEVGRTPVEPAVVQGAAAPVILEQARTLPADLVVLGTHGRSGFERFMLGSVTERVLRKAPCPVLTVPPRAADAVAVGPVVFNQILCGVDFSPASQKALAYAASLASESGAHLTVMHVVEPRPLYEPVAVGGGSYADVEAAATEAATARLRDVAPRVPRVTPVVATGKPYRVLLDRARADRSDLIVIGVHSGVADRVGFFGSTTNHIVRESACPVLSLRG
jgi:nucleotide-binding universal stress UspA family protein